jgi:hypothetical protein
VMFLRMVGTSVVGGGALATHLTTMPRVCSLQEGKDA